MSFWCKIKAYFWSKKVCIFIVQVLTEVIIMKYRHLTTGQVVLLIIGLIVILGICYALESNGKDDATCAFAGCNRTVTHGGDYCYQHDTYAKRRKATYGTSSSYSHSTSSSTTSSSSNSSSSSYKPSNSKTVVDVHMQRNVRRQIRIEPFGSIRN